MEVPLVNTYITYVKSLNVLHSLEAICKIFGKSIYEVNEVKRLKKIYYLPVSREKACYNIATNNGYPATSNGPKLLGNRFTVRQMNFVVTVSISGSGFEPTRFIRCQHNLTPFAIVAY